VKTDTQQGAATLPVGDRKGAATLPVKGNVGAASSSEVAARAGELVRGDYH
jgi:hypothetical protein